MAVGKEPYLGDREQLEHRDPADSGEPRRGERDRAGGNERSDSSSLGTAPGKPARRGRYGHPAPASGATVVSTWPVRGSLATSSRPCHSRTTMNSVRPSSPPSAHEKQQRSSSIVSSISPPSRTRTHRSCGTSAYQTAPLASRQMPSGAASPSSAQTRRPLRLPSSAISKAVSLPAYDSATIRVRLS